MSELMQISCRRTEVEHRPVIDRLWVWILLWAGLFKGRLYCALHKWSVNFFPRIRG